MEGSATVPFTVRLITGCAVRLESETAPPNTMSFFLYCVSVELTVPSVKVGLALS